jgi:hypothetical protein
MLFGYVLGSLFWLMFLAYAKRETVMRLMDWLDSLHLKDD